MRAYSSNLATRKSILGLALIELMIAMVLGLVVIGAVTGVLLSNTQSFRATKSLSQIQDSARLGFEVMARDIRQAGSIACGNDVAVTNLVTAAQTGAPWHLDWAGGTAGQLVGYSGSDTISGLSNRVNGTEAIRVHYVENTGAVVDTYNSGSHSYTLSSTAGLRNGAIAFVCNETAASVFQATVSGGDLSAAATVNINTQPGVYDRNAVAGRLISRIWYIGNNGRTEEGGRSLYLAELGVNAAGAPEAQEIEIASGVTNLEFLYRLTDTSDLKTSAQVNTQWPLVNAVQVNFSLLGQDANVTIDSSVNSGRIGRSFSSIVALRNRIL